MVLKKLTLWALASTTARLARTTVIKKAIFFSKIIPVGGNDDTEIYFNNDDNEIKCSNCLQENVYFINNVSYVITSPWCTVLISLTTWKMTMITSQHSHQIITDSQPCLKLKGQCYKCLQYTFLTPIKRRLLPRIPKTLKMMPA